MLTAAGIGSGLDVDNIVSQLMEIERQPLVALQQKQTQLDAQVSAFGTLKSALATFQTAMQNLSTPSALKIYTATSTNDDIFTASANSSAAPATFDIEVVRLAEHHKFGSAEFLDTDTFGGKNNDALTIQVGADPAAVMTVDLSSALTLSGVRDAINTATDNPGVSASIIFGNDGNQKLILSADDSGAANALTLDYSGKIKDDTFDFETVNDIGNDLDKLDAEVVVDGYTVTRGTNTIDDMLSGISLDLHNAEPGTEHTLTVGRNLEAVGESVTAFAEAYNELQTTIETLRANELEADSSIFSIGLSLRSTLNTPASGLSSGLSYLAEIGVSFDRNGIMTVNGAAVESALENDFSAVSELFATDGQGYANRLDTLVEGWLGIEGLIQGRTDGLEDRKRSLETREISLEYRLSQVEANLYAQFTNLDTLLGSMQVTSDYLSQQLKQLPTYGSNNN